MSIDHDLLTAVEREPWKARIERDGAWCYSIHLTSGIICLSEPCHAWTAKGAIRKARRLVARWNAKQSRRHWTITG